MSGLARRGFLGAASALVASGLAARAAGAKPKEAHPVEPPPGLEFRTLVFEKTAMYGRGATAIAAIPKDRPAGARLPLVVLLPGGEHTMQKREHGCWGWWSDFGLGDTDTALRRGSLGDADLQGFAPKPALEALNAQLAAAPYRGLVIVTPFVLRRQTDPRPHGAMNTPFLRQLVERARAELPVLPDRASTGLGGVSASGLWTLYCGAALDDLFSTLVAVQPYTDGYEKILRASLRARTRPQRIRLVTSLGDRLRAPTVKLVERLKKDAIEIELAEYPGPHEPKWVRGPGGVEILLSFDRMLARAAPAAAVPSSAPIPATPSASGSAPSPVEAPAPASTPAAASRGETKWIAALVGAAAGGGVVHAMRRRGRARAAAEDRSRDP